MSVNNNLKANQDFHKEHLLTECAEVIQSIRYGEWDRNLWERGWTSFKTTYPTWMYTLEYLPSGRSWKVNKMLDNNGAHIVNPEFLEANGTFADALERIVVVKETENGDLIETWERDYALRGVFIDNSAPQETLVKCFVKTNKFDGRSEDKMHTYDSLEFIMMNYL